MAEVGIPTDEVRGAVKVNNRLDAAGLLQVAQVALQLLHAGGGAQQGDQVAAGRIARNADAVRVEVILGGVGPQPANGRLAVLDLCGEHGVPAQSGS